MKLTKLYWIRLPEHTDIMSQGYVGHTTKVVASRCADHKIGRGKMLEKAMAEKPGITWDDLVIEEWVIPDDAKHAIEGALRPTENIGWNTERGGKRDGRPAGSGVSKSHKLSNVQKRNIVKKFNTGKYTKSALGRLYKVRQEAIGYIINVWAKRNGVV